MLLSGFVRGRVRLHFADREQARSALRAAGFDAAEIYSAAQLAGGDDRAGSRLANTLEASVD